MCSSREESPVKIDHAHKLLEALCISGSGKVDDSIDFTLEWLNTLVGDEMSKEIKRRNSELTFIDVYYETLFLESLK